MSGDGIFVDLVPMLNAAGLEKAMANIGRMSEKMGSDIERSIGTKAEQAAARSVAAAERSFAATQSGVERSLTAMSAAGDRAAQQAIRFEGAQAKLNAAIEKYGAGSAKAVEAERRLEIQRIKTTAATRDLAAASRNYEAAQASATRASDAHTAATERSAAASGLAGKALSAAKYGFAGFAIAAVAGTKSAADFERSQHLLVSSAGESASNLKLVSDGIVKMAGDVGYTAQQLSKGMYTVESAGYRGAQGLNVMKAAAEGAKAENADLTEVANGLTTTLRDFHIPAEKANDVMSKMVVAVSHSKVGFADFARSLHSIEPVAASAGLKFEDIYTALARMTQSGMTADQSTEYLRNSVIHLMKPTGPMITALEQLGINSQDLALKLGDRGLSGSLQMISDKIRSQMNPAQQVVIDTMYKNAQATNNAKAMYDKLAPSVKSLADEFTRGEIGPRQFMREVDKLGGPNAAMGAQWLQNQKKIEGFSNTLKTGKSTIQSFGQAMAQATGTQSALQVALQVSGENAGATNDLLAKLNKTTAESDGTVKGFHEVMDTAKGKADQFSAGIKSVGITMGTVLLPAVTKVLEVGTDLTHWMTQHEGITKGLTYAVLGVGAAWLTWKAAKGTFNLVKDGVDNVKSAVKGIKKAASEAGAWLNWSKEAGKTGAAWVGAKAKAVGSFVATRTSAAVEAAKTSAAWIASQVRSAAGWAAAKAKAVASFVATAASAVASATTTSARWLYAQGVIAAGWVAEKAKTVATFVATSVAAGLQATETAAAWVAAQVKAAAGWAKFALDAARAFAEAAAAAVSNALKSAAAWVAQNARAAASFVAVTAALVAQSVASKAVAAAQWLINAAMSANPIGVVITVIVALVAALVLAYQKSETFRNIVQGAMRAVGAIFHWLYDNAVKPVMDAIGKIWNWLYDNVIRPVIDYIKADIKAWGDTFNWIHDKVIEPVGEKIGNVIQGIKDGFHTAADAIETVWNKIKSIIAPPVRFIVDTVYNHGIVPIWNGVASVFGLGKINTVDVSGIMASGGYVGAPQGYAGGGVHSGPGILPGYQPGTDNIPAVLSPGESVLTPEATRYLGAKTILGLNAMSGRKSANQEMAERGGKSFFSGGGIAGPIHAEGGFYHGQSHKDVQKANQGTTGGKDTAKGGDPSLLKLSIAEIVGAPLQWVAKTFGGFVAKALAAGGTPSQFTDMVKHIPSHIVDAIGKKVKEWADANKDFTQLPASVANNAQLLDWLHQAEKLTGTDTSWDADMLRLIARESGGNVHAINLTDSNAKAGDPSRGLTQTIGATFRAYHQPGTSNDIYDPVANIAASINYIKGRYGGDHSGAASGHNYAGGGIVPAIMAAGGYTPTPREQEQLGGAPVATSMWTTIKQQFPTATLNSAKTDHGADRGYHPEGKAIDIGGPLGAIDDWIFKNLHDDTAQLIYNGPPSELIYNVHEQGHGGVATITDQAQLHNQVYAADLPGHADHVHWAAEHEVGSRTIVIPGVDTTTAPPNADDPMATPGATLTDDDKRKIADLNGQADAQDAQAKKYDAAVADYEARLKNPKLTATQRAKLQAARDKAKLDADNARRKAQQYRDKAKQVENTANDGSGGTSNLDSSDSSSSSSSSSDSSDSGSMLTWHDFGSRLGGIAADSATETLGLTAFDDPNQYAAIRVPWTIGNAIANPKKNPQPLKAGTIGAPPAAQLKSTPAPGATGGDQTPGVTAKQSPLTVTPVKDDKKIRPMLHDDGGWLQPGYTLVENRSNRPEPVLNFDDKRKLDALQGGGDLGSGMKGMVVIEEQHNHAGNGKQVARDIYREMAAHQGSGPR